MKTRPKQKREFPKRLLVTGEVALIDGVEAEDFLTWSNLGQMAEGSVKEGTAVGVHILEAVKTFKARLE